MTSHWPNMPASSRYLFSHKYGSYFFCGRRSKSAIAHFAVVSHGTCIPHTQMIDIYEINVRAYGSKHIIFSALRQSDGCSTIIIVSVQVHHRPPVRVGTIHGLSGNMQTRALSSWCEQFVNRARTAPSSSSHSSRSGQRSCSHRSTRLRETVSQRTASNDECECVCECVCTFA